MLRIGATGRSASSASWLSWFHAGMTDYRSERWHPTSTAITDLGACPLCGRALIGGSSVNQHHLVPRSRNGRESVALHRICHAAIHAALSEKELERQYNTIEKLREHPQLSRFIAWIHRKPPEFWVRTRRPR